MFTSVVLVTFISLSAAQRQETAQRQVQFICDPEGNQFQADPKQCDKYWDCNYVEPQPILCPDGLVFDSRSRKEVPCDHYFVVDCGDRTNLQDPKGPNDFCPRLNGFYSHPDPSNCTVFYSCTNGVSTEYPCSPGLWFNEYTGACDWPKNTDRENCARENGNGQFQCPGPLSASEAETNVQPDPHPQYPDDADCGNFFICLNRISLRPQQCEIGLVYNSQTKKCDDPENVPECLCYYYDTLKGEKDPRCEGDNKRRK